MQENLGKVNTRKRKYPWFRFYAEALDDPKVQRLPPHLFKTWVNLLCLASQTDGKLPSIDDIAFKLRISANDAMSHVDELILAGLIDIDPDGIRKPHNWQARQFASDSVDPTAAERMRRYRQRNADRNDRNAQRNDTALDTDTEAETEKKTPLPPKRGPGPAEALKAFEAYNALALKCGLQQSAKLTPDRSRKIVARLKDYGLDGWDRALANIERSNFLRGKNERGWRANLDFVLQASSFGKLHDGGYNDTDVKPASKPSAVPYTLDEKAAKAMTDKLLADFMQGGPIQ